MVEINRLVVPLTDIDYSIQRIEYLFIHRIAPNGLDVLQSM